MAVVIAYVPKQPEKMYTSDARLYVNFDRTKIVPEDSPEAAYLLVAAGGEILESEARKYGLLAEPKPVEVKAVPAPPETKEAAKPPVKAVTPQATKAAVPPAPKPK